MAKMRSKSGSGILHSVGGVMLITSITMGAVLLMINAGLAVNYKQKVEYVALESARYANGLTSAKKHQETVKFADDMMRKLGVPYGHLSIDLKEKREQGKAATECRVKCSSLGLIGNIFGLIDVEGQAIAPKTEIIAGSTVSIDSGDRGPYYVPIIEEEDKNSMESLGTFGSSGYLSVSSQNPESRPRDLNWLLPAEYRKDAHEAYTGFERDDDDTIDTNTARLQTPRAHGQLREILHKEGKDFPRHSFNGVYSMELRGGGTILDKKD